MSDLVTKLKAVGAAARANWQFLATVATVLLAAAGVKLTVQPGPADRPPEVIVIVPAGPVVESVPPVVGDVAPLSPGARLALQVAVVLLERRAPRTDGVWDDRLLELLKLIGSDAAAFERAATAARGP